MTDLNPATFVLVAGAAQPAWIWHRVVPLLEAAGHTVIARDLPGMGENRSVAVGDVTLDIWADFVANLVLSAYRPVFLVGHSRGGLVVGEASEKVADRVAGIIYVSGLAVPPGKTAIQVMGREGAEDGPPLTEDGRAFWIPAEFAIPLFYHRCAEADAKALADHMCPEPLTPIATPSKVTAEGWGRIPRAYIETTDDQTLSLAQQRLIQDNAPCDPVISIDSDHSPFMSATEELVEALLVAAASMARA